MTKAATSLFERLIDENPEESFEKNPREFATIGRVQDSILKDIAYLLNTRVSSFYQTLSMWIR